MPDYQIFEAGDVVPQSGLTYYAAASPTGPIARTTRKHPVF